MAQSKTDGDAVGEDGGESGRDRTWKSTIDRDGLEDTDHRKLSRKGCMAVIGFKIATRGYERTMLGKEDLNSVYWYITGKQYAPWLDFGTERSPDIVDMREGVADAVGFCYGRFEKRSDYRDPYWVVESRSETGGEQPRRFRVAELRAIVHELRTTEDKRQ